MAAKSPTCKIRTGPAIDDLCRAPAIYMAWTANCKLCAWFGLECEGHPTCAEHGAALRTTAMKDQGEDATLLRICTLA